MKHRILLGLLPALACALFAVAPARADPGLFVGLTDDLLKELGSPVVTAANDLGAQGFRITVEWDGAQTTLASSDVTALDRAVAAAAGMRVVLVVDGAAVDAPLDDAARNTYCTYVKNIVARYPTLTGVVIWNEPNKTASWQPQFNPDGTSAAPAAYEALLARCWDVLHAFRPSANVFGLALSPDGNDNPNAVSNISHSPGNFIRKLGLAYRASGRTLPIFDTVSHHVYGATTAERPWKQHTGQTRISEGDWDKLMTNFHTAFDGTGQPVPGQCLNYRCVWIWYLEGGWQTSIDADKMSLYSSTENVTTIPDDAGGEPDSPPPSATSPAPDQRTQFLDAVRLAYCQDYVGAFFNFLLRDEPDLRAWQSGVLWADSTPKDSYDDFRAAIALVNEDTVDCNALKGGLPPRPDTTPPAPPAGLGADVVPGQTRVTLDWADGPETDVQGFDVYRSTSSGGPFTKLNSAPVPASSYVDEDVTLGQTYYYAVVAVDTAWNQSGPSDVVSATPPPGPTAVTVRRLDARRIGRTVELRWRTASDTLVLGFHVYREERGRRSRLDRRLIAAGQESGGAWYAFRDRSPGRASARYWLEVVRLDGTRVRFGPVRVRRS